MPFKAILKDLVDSVPYATGAILADWEGEAVDLHCHYDPYELKVVAAHKGILLGQLKETCTSILEQDVEHLWLTISGRHTVVGTVGHEYTLVMTLEEGAVTGVALNRMRQAIEALKKEIY